MWASVDHQKDNDKSFVDMIENVEALLSQVENLKTRIDTVKYENPGKFCSATQSNIVGPSNGFNRSVHNSASFAGKEIPVPGSFAGKSELYAEDQLMTDNALSIREGITPSIESANRTQFEVQGENVSFIIWKLFQQFVCHSCFPFLLHKFPLPAPSSWFCLVSIMQSIHEGSCSKFTRIKIP